MVMWQVTMRNNLTFSYKLQESVAQTQMDFWVVMTYIWYYITGCYCGGSWSVCGSCGRPFGEASRSNAWHASLGVHFHCMPLDSICCFYKNEPRSYMPLSYLASYGVKFTTVLWVSVLWRIYLHCCIKCLSSFHGINIEFWCIQAEFFSQRWQTLLFCWAVPKTQQWWNTECLPEVYLDYGMPC